MNQHITIAIAKGRILDETLPLLQRCGVSLQTSPEQSRQMIIPTNVDEIKVAIVRPHDVPTYVQYAVADIGITGSDVLLEKENNTHWYEMIDLKIAHCKMVLAGRDPCVLKQQNLRVATKYPNITKTFFNEKQAIELIELKGAIELATLSGLSDCIVDLIATGKTLKTNNLMVFEEIVDISSRIIVNPARYKLNHTRMCHWLNKIENVI